MKDIKIGDTLGLSFYLYPIIRYTGQLICEPFNGEQYKFETGLDSSLYFEIKETEEETRDQITKLLTGKIKHPNIYSKHFDKDGDLHLYLEPEFIEKDFGIKNMTKEILKGDNKEDLEFWIKHLKDENYLFKKKSDIIEWEAICNIIDEDGNSLRAIDFRNLF